MPFDLSSQTIASTYNQLLHIDGGPIGTEGVVYGGAGIATALKLGTSSASVDNIKIDGNTISSTDPNGNINLTPNGTGEVAIPKVNITGGVMTGGTISFGVLGGRAYASFSDITDQTGSTTAATAVKFGTTEIAGAGITMVTDGSNLTRLTFAAAGTYLVAPNLQFYNSSSADHDVIVWLALDGSNVARSGTRVTVPKVGDGGHGFFQFNYFITVSAGQYIQVMWSPDNVAVTLDYIAAAAGPPSVPAVPSSVLIAERIA